MLFLLMLSGVITLQSSSCKVELKVLIPQTEQERVIGLSKTENLSPNQGMLFKFDHEDQYVFTMKNTSIPLALFFFDREFKLIEKRTCGAWDPQPIYSKPNCQYVLETHPEVAKNTNFALKDTKLQLSPEGNP